MSFVAVVLVATIVVTLVVGLNNRNKVGGLEQANTLSCKNFEILKKAVNDFHGTLRSFLLTARDARLADVKFKAQSNKKINEIIKEVESGKVDKIDPPITKLKVQNTVRIDLQTAILYQKLINNARTVNATCAQKTHGAIKK